MDNNSLKWCARRKHWVPRTAFGKNPSWCRECQRDYMRELRADPEYRERERARSRVENMTPAQVERKRARNRVENMTPEQAERNRARKREWRAANPTGAARGHAMFDTPAVRTVVLAVMPKLADGRPACPICVLRPAERVEHRHMFATEGGELAPGELRGYVCASCNITLSQYESRADELSPEDPAQDLALAGDVPAALRLTAEALESGAPCKPLVRRLANQGRPGPFDKTAAGYRRAADYIEYSPVRRLMDSGDPAIWHAINDAFNAGGNTAKLAAIHCAEAGYRDCAEAYGIDVEAAIRHFAARADAPAHAKRQYGQGETGRWRRKTGPVTR